MTWKIYLSFDPNTGDCLSVLSQAAKIEYPLFPIQLEGVETDNAIFDTDEIAPGRGPKALLIFENIEKINTDLQWKAGCDPQVASIPIRNVTWVSGPGTHVK